MNVMDWRFLVTIIITVALGITTIVLALKLANKRQPVWAYKTTKKIGLGSNMPPELKLTFNEQSVSDVYQTIIILFNKGNEAILKENVTESVVIHFRGANILRQPTILAKSREGIGVSAKQVIKEGDDAVAVSFQYLDHNDGVVIEVWHTTSQDIKTSGNIIGTSQIRYIGEFVPTSNQSLLLTVMNFVSPITLISVMLWVTIKKEWGFHGTPGDIAGAIFILALGSALLWLTAAPLLRCRRFPRWSVVKS